jgi:hypothetical protein
MFLAYAPAFAQQTLPAYNYATDAHVSKGIEDYLCSPKSDGSAVLYQCINQLYKLAIVIASVVGVFFIVIAGYVYMSSDGSSEAVDKAKSILESTITSIVILLAGWVLLNALNPDLVQFHPITPPAVQTVTAPSVTDVNNSPTPNPNVPKTGCDYTSNADAYPDMVVVPVQVWDANGQTATLNVTVNKIIQDRIKQVFSQVYASPEKFSIRDLQGYNFNYVTTPTGPVLSAHACGLAVDVNSADNPMVSNDNTNNSWKPCGQNASGCDKFSINPNGSLVQAFNSAGFGWGGNFISLKDYMHFSCIQNEHGNCPFIKKH